MLSHLWKPSTAVVIAFCLLVGAATYTLKQPLVLLIMPLLFPAAWMLFRFPIWVCLAFIVFSFFRIHEAVPVLMPFKLPQLFALGSFAVLAWHIFMTNKITVYWHPLMNLLLVFFGFVVLGAIFATDRGSAMGMLQGSYVKIIAMVFAIAWLVRQPKDFALAIRLFVLAGLLIGSIAISNKLNGIGLVEGTRVTIGRNIGSMIGDPNDLALVLTFPLSFALSGLLFSNDHWLKRFGYAAATAILIWAILCTQSRGGLLGICAVSGSLAWQRINNKMLVMAGGAFLMVVLLAAAGISDRSSGGAAEEGVDESAMGRIYAWQAAINMATHHPITGVGLNNFYANYYFYSPYWDGKNHAVHSTWFQVLAETGFVGFSLFVVLVGATFKLTRTAITRLNARIPNSVSVMAFALQSGLIGFCTSGTFLTQGFIWPLYILMALTLALTYYLDHIEVAT